MSRSAYFLAAATVLATIGGCQRVLYRAETILHEDGSVERAIYQPVDATPEAARDPTRWRRVTFAQSPDILDKQGWPVSLRQFPDHQHNDGYDYFAAYQEFRSAGSIPNYWSFDEPHLAVPPARLVRDYRQADFVFVEEYRWSETLTDGLTPERMKKSRNELADLCIDVGRDVFNEALGRDYDASALEHWCRTEGKAWLAELTDSLFFHAALHKGKRVFEEEAALDQMAAICARHGLHLKRDGKFLPEEDGEQALQAYVTALVMRHVRRRDGKPVSRDVAQSWVRALLGGQPGGRPGLLQAAADQTIARKYGGRAAFEQRILILFLRAFGHFFLTFGNISFDYALTMPGEILETNGEILSEHRVRWRFPLHQAFPLGYAMSCRSLLCRTQAQTLLLGKPLLVSRDDMLQFMELVADDKPLLETLRESARHTTLAPFYTYVKKLSRGSKEQERADRLMRILRLP
jgi:hypothetical protein